MGQCLAGAFLLARARRPREAHHGIQTGGTPLRGLLGLLIAVAFFVLIGAISYFTRYVPSPEEVEFDKTFDREAVLVKTCGPEPGVATAVPIKVYRFEAKLWYRDDHRWRQVDAKPDNVCDLLDIDAAHRPPPGPELPIPVPSHLIDLFRKSEPTPTPPKEIPPAKPNG
jgi:hypothetical protein